MRFLFPTAPLTLLVNILMITPGASEAVSQEPVVSNSSITSDSSFKVLGTVSGIEVIDWKTPPTVSPDAPLNILLEEGAGKFESDLIQRLSLGAATTASELTQRLNDPAYVLHLSRYEILRQAGAICFDEMLVRREGKDFLTRFLSNQDWMDDFLIAGDLDPKTAAAQLHNLCSLYRYDKECTVPLYRKLACAYARVKSNDWKDDVFQYRLLDAYQAQKTAHKRGKMHNSFDRLETWEMLYVVIYGRADGRSTEYLVNQLNYQRGRYYGACWTLPYRRNTIFGDSIHGRHYFTPWTNGYYGVQKLHRVGGVCGTLSNYGVSLARAHGIPSFAVGQPGHCAYMLRGDDKKWGTAYSVTGNTGAGSILGGGDETIVNLMQAVFDNASRPELLRSSRYHWQAKMYAAHKNLETAKAAYLLSLKESPLHLNHWKSYAAYLATLPGTNEATWIAFSEQFIRNLKKWQRPCWDTLAHTVLPHLGKQKPEDRIALITQWHRAMEIEPDTHQIGGRSFSSHINSQTKIIKDSAQQASLLRFLLKHYNDTRHLTTVIEWGRKALTSKVETTPIFLNELALFSKNSPDSSKSFERVLGTIILDAEKRRDAATLKSTSRLAYQIFQDKYHKIRHLPGNFKPESIPQPTQVFPGKLLSSNAVPVLNQPLDNYTSLGHLHALQPGQTGLLITRKQKNATITLHLPGKSQLSGLILWPRFEKDDYIKRILPLVVSTSVDGKTWTKVYETSDIKKIYEVDLSKLAPEATQIRVESSDKERKDHLMLRGIHAYGKALY